MKAPTPRALALALNPVRLAPGLPDREVPLDEFKALLLLLHPSADAASRNAVWAELVRRARTSGPAWVIGGGRRRDARPAPRGLRRAVSAVGRDCRHPFIARAASSSSTVHG